MPSPKVIQLREILADKFPGLRLKLDESPAVRPGKLENSSPISDLFENRLSKGTLNELVAGKDVSGSATLMHELIHHAASQNQIIGLVDGADSFDVTSLPSTTLSRLLWVRCGDAEMWIKH